MQINPPCRENVYENESQSVWIKISQEITVVFRV